MFGFGRRGEDRSANSGRRPGRRAAYHKPLRIERLEDRRLLAITVTTLVDEADGSIVDGDISLRDAISLAPAGEEINFDAALTAGGPATLNLTISSAITINKALTVSGPGAGLLTIDASMIDPTPTQDNGDGRRIFVIDDGTGTRQPVVIQGLTLTGGDSPGFGGAISSTENLQLRKMVIRNNAANTGGGVGASGPLAIFDSEIFENHSDLAGGGVHLNAGVAFQYQIVGSTIRDNTSGGRGGGVFSIVPGGSQMQIIDSLIADNTASLDGGGLAATGPHVVIRSAITGNESSMNGGGIKSVNALTVESSRIGGNSAANGGGIHADVIVTVRNSTITNNTATGNAGGILIQNSNSLLSQVTVSGNRANNNGGGIHTSQPFTLRHSTIANNRADFDNAGGGVGGGLFGSQPVGNAIVVDQSLIATNTRGAATRDDVSGSAAIRFSLVGDETGGTLTDQGGNKIGTAAMPVDPLLGALAENDGPVLRGGLYLLTHSLQVGSLALDAGDPAAVPGGTTTFSTDQRGTGFLRIHNATALPTAVIDIGAFERQPIPLFADYNDDNVVNAADYTIWRNTLGSTTDLRADGDRNLIVDMNDFLYWKSRHGQTPALGAGGDDGSSAGESIAVVSPVVLPSAQSQADSLDVGAQDVAAGDFIGSGASQTSGRTASVLMPELGQNAGGERLEDLLWSDSALPVTVSSAKWLDADEKPDEGSGDGNLGTVNGDNLAAMFAELGSETL